MSFLRSQYRRAPLPPAGPTVHLLCDGSYLPTLVRLQTPQAEWPLSRPVHHPARPLLFQPPVQVVKSCDSPPLICAVLAKLPAKYILAHVSQKLFEYSALPQRRRLDALGRLPEVSGYFSNALSQIKSKNISFFQYLNVQINGLPNILNRLFSALALTDAIRQARTFRHPEPIFIRINQYLSQGISFLKNSRPFPSKLSRLFTKRLDKSILKRDRHEIKLRNAPKKADIPSAGGRGANLGERRRRAFQLPLALC